VTRDDKCYTSLMNSYKRCYFKYLCCYLAYLSSLHRQHPIYVTRLEFAPALLFIENSWLHSEIKTEISPSKKCYYFLVPNLLSSNLFYVLHIILTLWEFFKGNKNKNLVGLITSQKIIKTNVFDCHLLRKNEVTGPSWSMFD